MGYVHYWTCYKKIDAETWGKLVDEVKLIKKHLPQHINSSDGYYDNAHLYINGCICKRNPIFDKDKILFNGGNCKLKDRILGDDGYWVDKNDYSLSHDTFHFTREVKKSSCYCKTARKPYDFFVQCVLLLAKKHLLKNITISTDGDQEDWIESYNFIKKHIEFKLALKKCVKF